MLILSLIILNIKMILFRGNCGDSSKDDIELISNAKIIEEDSVKIAL